MRLRNIKGADETIENHVAAINEPKAQRGKWNSIFQNDNPIHIEIGMGKGQFLLTQALHNPTINYIGIERYSSVLLRALEKYDTDEFVTVDLTQESEYKLNNIKFICMDARELAEVFAQGEVKQIYLNFSDPWPKARHAKRRLPSKEFLACYEQVLEKAGTVEFKTDNRLLFEFALEQVKVTKWKLLAYTFDLHQDAVLVQGNVMTEYEAKFSAMGHPIHKMIIAR